MSRGSREQRRLLFDMQTTVSIPKKIISQEA